MTGVALTRPQDRETLDATLTAPPGTHEIRARSELGGERIPLTDKQFMDLITVHVADFIEQVGKHDHRPAWISSPCCRTAAAAPRQRRLPIKNIEDLHTAKMQTASCWGRC